MDCRLYAEELGPKHWPLSRFTHVMKLRQAALKAAREHWADYILVRVRSAAMLHHLIKWPDSYRSDS